MNTDRTGFNTCKECHKMESRWNHTTADHKEGERLEDRRNVGESNCKFGDGRDQRVQSLMFMMMMIYFVPVRGWIQQEDCHIWVSALFDIWMFDHRRISILLVCLLHFINVRITIVSLKQWFPKCASQGSQRIRYRFSGDPWIHFWNG